MHTTWAGRREATGPEALLILALGCGWPDSSLETGGLMAGTTESEEMLNQGRVGRAGLGTTAF